MDLLELPVWRLRELLQKKEISCQELVSYYLDRISQKDSLLHSYLYVNERALEEARAIDEKSTLLEQQRPVLEGIPVAVKDNICVQNQPATCASRILENFIPPYEATVIKRLRDAGAIILGKTNMDEFAFGSSTENSAFGPTRNPYDQERVPGGSSGGSAAAVAANLCAAALGSDTGGSIRQPAAFCGVVGLKPTYGRVSRFGLVAFASSLDQIGPLTRDVRDASLLLSVIAGADRYDSTSLQEPVFDYFDGTVQDLSGLHFGLPREYLTGEVNPCIKESINRVGKKIEQLGGCLEEVSLPHTQAGIATYYVIATAEASANLARFDGIKYGYRTSHYKNLGELYLYTRGEGFGQEVKRRIILGTYVLSAGYYQAYYLKGQRVRTLIRKDFSDVFEKVHLLLTPTTPELPFKIGEKSSDPLKMYLSDVFTVNVNLAGLPAISMPAGKSSEGLPIGFQIIGPAFQEKLVLKAAGALEQALR